MRAAIFLVVFTLFASSALADSTVEIQRLCSVAHPGLTEMQARCFKLHSTAERRLKGVVKSFDGDDEVRAMAERCASRNKGDSGDTDWRRAKICFDRLLHPYRSYLEARAKTDAFTGAVLSYCLSQRRKSERPRNWHAIERCRERQSNAGHYIAKIYRTAAPNGVVRQRIDECAQRHTNRKGHIVWSAVENCHEQSRRR